MLGLFLAYGVHAQNLDSSNYRILDSTMDSGGGTATSSNYSALISISDPFADSRLVSGNYETKSGFPSGNGTLANVPVVRCFETTTNSGSSTCLNFPNSNGATGECGPTGCYDRAKVEIDAQDNPSDTLYLLKVDDVTNSQTYYVQSDHTLGASFDLTSFMTICQLEGRDVNDTACDDSGDGNWNVSLQRYDVYGLLINTQYNISASAMSGDFTETRFSPTVTATTVSPTISFDIDVAATDTDSPAPYSIDLGEITSFAVNTAADRIWLDMGSNSINGVNVYVRDLNNGLHSPTTLETIPSESEDLGTDSNHTGGFGLKVGGKTQGGLGPLQASATFDTAGSNDVGAISTTNSLLFFTDTSSANLGQVSVSRSSVYVKARSAIADLPSADLSDEITFISVANF